MALLRKTKFLENADTGHKNPYSHFKLNIEKMIKIEKSPQIFIKIVS